jgi:hypothetical protein
MHQETFYSPPKKDQDGKSYSCVRKPVSSLTKEELANILDPEIKKIVAKKLDELGGDVKKFVDPKNHPFMTAKDGRKIPIHKVRVKKMMSPFKVSGDGRERYVTSETNHHLEIVEVKDKEGNTKWDGHLVSQFEAMRRLRAGEPVVKMNHAGEKFLFSLASKECLVLKDDSGNEIVCIVRSISQLATGNIPIWLRYIFDARPATEYRNQIKRRKDLKKKFDEKLAQQAKNELPIYLFKTPNSLKEADAKKVLIDPLGNIRWAND